MNNDINIDSLDRILPVLPLRDLVLFPGMIAPLFVGRERSIIAVESALKADQQIFVIAQKDTKQEAPKQTDLYQIGVVATIMQVLRLPNGRLRILVEGLERAKLKELKQGDDMLRAVVKTVRSTPLTLNMQQSEVLASELFAFFENHFKQETKVFNEILDSMNGIDDFAKLADTIAAQLDLPMAISQEILMELDLGKRIDLLIDILRKEELRTDLNRIVSKRVKKEIDKSQREYLLNEQLKAIQKELREISGETDEFSELEHKIQTLSLSPEAKEKAEFELKKLRSIPSMSPEQTVIRSYLDWLVKLPWEAQSEEKIDLKQL